MGKIPGILRLDNRAHHINMSENFVSLFKIFISRLFPCTVVCITVVLPITRDWEVMQSELTITLVAPLAIGPYVM